MMEFEFSPVEEPKKATEKHVKELNDKIDNLTKQVDGFDTLTVSGIFCKEYERPTIGNSRDSAKDVIEAIRYLEKL